MADFVYGWYLVHYVRHTDILSTYQLPCALVNARLGWSFCSTFESTGLCPIGVQ